LADKAGSRLLLPDDDHKVFMLAIEILRRSPRLRKDL